MEQRIYFNHRDLKESFNEKFVNFNFSMGAIIDEFLHNRNEEKLYRDGLIMSTEQYYRRWIAYKDRRLSLKWVYSSIQSLSEFRVYDDELLNQMFDRVYDDIVCYELYELMEMHLFGQKRIWKFIEQRKPVKVKFWI